MLKIREHIFVHGKFNAVSVPCVFPSALSVTTEY